MMIDRGCIPFPGKGAICHGTHLDRRGESAINHLIMKNLRLVGHTCEQVFDGAAAVDAVLTGHFDLVILDVMLPKLSGFEVSGQIRIAGVPIHGAGRPQRPLEGSAPRRRLYREGGTRPVLVISNDIGNKHSPKVIIAAITSRVRKKKKLPTHLYLGQIEGIPANSIIIFEQLRTIDKSRLKEHLTHLDEQYLKSLEFPLLISIGVEKRRSL